VDDDWGDIHWNVFAFYGGLLDGVCDWTVTGFGCQWMGSFKSRNVMKGSGNKLFSGRCLASGSECFFVDVFWVLGIVNSPPTEVCVVCRDEAALCDDPTLVFEL
jgi:hypothetical protein